MKKQALLLLMGAVLLAVPAPAAAFAAGSDSAVVTFRRPTLFHNVVLQGTYVIVHDDAAMATSDQPCTHIYRYENGKAGEEVAAFRCRPAQAVKVDRTRFWTRPSRGLDRVLQFQFAGQTEAHQVL
ncbi:MAG TPA: hypothetical protein VGR48_06615 [Terriglobales bacterium]|nr:hypothetical protein [Terriglobales bacterium]